MKKLILASLLIILTGGSLFAQDTANQANKNGYSQLIGFKGGGELYLANFSSDWSTGVFFETVLAPVIGLEIELTKATIPLTNYTFQPSGLTVIGQGKKDYVEVGGGLKFYIHSVSICLGLTYNSFVSGYMVDSTLSLYMPLPNTEYNYFAVYLGPELTAQVSTDLFTKVGIKFIFGFTPGIVATPFYNETMGIRFYLSFAYGI